MLAAAGLTACLLLACRSRTPVKITLPAAGASFAGGQEIVFAAVIRNFEGSRITAVWNFGDGTSAKGLTVLHAYDRKGRYDASVTVTNEFASTAGDTVHLEITSSRFIKLSPDGAELPDNATRWSMVHDTATALVWEIKSGRDFTADYDNPHDADNLYTWYDDNDCTNGGDSGTPGDGTDTADFIDQINTLELGGFSDWRMPGCQELASIQDRARFNPAINTDYFPGTAPWYYWSGTTYDGFPGSACHIDFFGTKPASESFRTVGILNHYGYKSLAYHARAVRSAD